MITKRTESTGRPLSLVFRTGIEEAYRSRELFYHVKIHDNTVVYTVN